LIEEAKSLIDQKKFEEAIKVLDCCLKIKPDFALAHYYKGNILWEADKPYEAISSYRQAVDAVRNFDSAWFNLGFVYQHIGRYDAALECFEEASRLQPKDQSYLNMVAVILGFLERYKEAEIYIDRALEQGKTSQLWNNKAYLAILRGWKEEALDYVNKSLALDPDNASALDTKGFTLYKLGRLDDALLELDKGLGINPKNKYLWYHKGLVQFKLEDYDDAERCFERALELDDDFAEAHNDFASVLVAKKDPGHALEEVKKAIELKPDLSDAHVNLGKLLLQTGKTSQTFWDFWNGSASRRAAAVSLVVFAIGISSIFSFAIPSEKVETEKLVNGTPVEKTTVTTTPGKIPEGYFVIPGLAILVLLVPILRKAEVGPLKLELAESAPASS
jgi:tetratricopeptide (TPR) repeat protein